MSPLMGIGLVMMGKQKEHIGLYSIPNFHVVDELFHVLIGSFTSGLSPVAVGLAYTDWIFHYLLSPAKQLEISAMSVEHSFRVTCSTFTNLLTYCGMGQKVESCIDCAPNDQRFKDESWQDFPFSTYYQTFLLIQHIILAMSKDLRGANKHHLDVVSFINRQMLDAFSPSNFIWTNPQVINETMDSNGLNLFRGLEHFLQDLTYLISNKRPKGTELFRPGKEVAITPGKVIYKNELIELIQYASSTATVHKEPILFIPAWIMKYYILDLSPHNSLVRYLVEKGHTVYMISWKNPTKKDQSLRFEDYVTFGIEAAIHVILKSLPKDTKLHAVGYCLGGTLLAIAESYFCAKKSCYFKSITLLAAQTDFGESGELSLFIDESQVAFLEDMMKIQGYLDKHQMKGIFQLLKSNDLFWSRLIRQYLMGKQPKSVDLMAWSSDATRMPYKMHSEYLRQLFMGDDLSEGRFKIRDIIIDLSRITTSSFVVGTTMDHIAPWKSVYKYHLLTNAPVTFLLASGGHNVGIISEPGNPKGHFSILTTKGDAAYIAPEEWEKKAEPHDGSWWPAWQEWLVKESSKEMVIPPSFPKVTGKAHGLGDAPGQYVLEQ